MILKSRNFDPSASSQRRVGAGRNPQLDTEGKITMKPKGPHKEQILKLCRIVLRFGPQTTRILTDNVSEMYRMDVTQRTLGQWLYRDPRFSRHLYETHKGGGPSVKWCLGSLCLHKERTLSLRHRKPTFKDFHDRTG